VIDFLPACYPVGIITMLVDSKHRRLGDLLARTVLVRDETIDLARYDGLSSAVVSDQVMDVATSYLSRFESLDPDTQVRLGRRIAESLGLSISPSSSAIALRDAIRSRFNQD
jgi:hypothetical protein